MSMFSQKLSISTIKPSITKALLAKDYSGLQDIEAILKEALSDVYDAKQNLAMEFVKKDFKLSPGVEQELKNQIKQGVQKQEADFKFRKGNSN